MAPRGRTRVATSCDRGNDGHLVPLLERGFRALEEADILLVDIDVDEAADLAALLHEPLAQPGVLALQILDQVGDRLGGRMDLARALRHPPQGSGNAHENRHPGSPCLAGLEAGLGFAYLTLGRGECQRLSRAWALTSRHSGSREPWRRLRSSAGCRGSLVRKSRPDPVMYHRHS